MSKNILITGAGKGIGRSILFDCVRNKNFAYAIIRKKNDLIEIRKNINKDKCKLYLGDTGNINLIDRIITDSKKLGKKINGLVNNSGERQRGDFLKINNKKINTIFKNNFFNHFFLTQKIVSDFKIIIKKTLFQL